MERFYIWFWKYAFYSGILNWFLKKNQATILPPFFLGIIFFLQNGCPITNCFVTDNKTLLGSKSINQFDALIFHPRDMTPKENGVFMIPNQKKRQPHQNYVMFMVESSSHDNLDYHKFQDFFNLTMTFRRDSDFYRYSFFIFYYILSFLLFNYLNSHTFLTGHMVGYHL